MMKKILIAAGTVGVSPELTNENARTFPRGVVLTSLDDFTEVGVGGIVIAASGALHAEKAIGAPERGREGFGQKLPGRTAIEPRPVAKDPRGREFFEPYDVWSLQNLLVKSVFKHPKENTLVV